MSGLTTEDTEGTEKIVPALPVLKKLKGGADLTKLSVYFYLTQEHPRLKVWQHQRTGDFVRIVNCDSIDGACLIVEKCDAIGDIGQELYTCEQSDLVEITKESWEAAFPNDGVNLTFEEAAK
jgi:hypothetical protein